MTYATVLYRLRTILISWSPFRLRNAPRGYTPHAGNVIVQIPRCHENVARSNTNITVGLRLIYSRYSSRSAYLDGIRQHHSSPKLLNELRCSLERVWGHLGSCLQCNPQLTRDLKVQHRLANAFYSGDSVFISRPRDRLTWVFVLFMSSM